MDSMSITDLFSEKYKCMCLNILTLRYPNTLYIFKILLGKNSLKVVFWAHCYISTAICITMMI